MNTRNGVTLLVIILAIVAFVVARKYAPAPAAPQPVATIAYVCSGNKTITASYYQGESKPAAGTNQPPTPGGSVAITLSDGRTMTLPQTISADGARFANADESFVFWSKGNGVLVLENNQQKSYIGCIAVAPEPAGQSLPYVYSNSTDGFSLRLPAGYNINEKYLYQELGPGKDISGIKFTVSSSTVTGTNLSSDTYISLEGIPQTQNCSASLFLDHAAAHAVVDGGITYSVASSTGAGAGNRYEETVYAVPGTNPCIAMRYFVHYGAIQNYPPGLVHEFDKQALLGQFDAIRHTLVIVQ